MLVTLICVSRPSTGLYNYVLFSSGYSSSSEQRMLVVPTFKAIDQMRSQIKTDRVITDILTKNSSTSPTKPVMKLYKLTYRLPSQLLHVFFFKRSKTDIQSRKKAGHSQYSKLIGITGQCSCMHNMDLYMHYSAHHRALESRC